MLTERWSLITFGTKSEWVTLNSGSNGFKEISAVSKDFWVCCVAEDREFAAGCEEYLGNFL